MEKGMDQLDAAQLREHLPRLSERQKDRIQYNGAKIQVCEEQREGWTGKLPFYIFWCPRCDDFAYDYPHGFIENQYLSCHQCMERVSFVPWWAGLKELYNILRWKIGGGK